MKGSYSTFFRFGVPDEAPAMAALTASLPSGILRGGGRGGVAGGEAAFCGDATGLQASPDIDPRSVSLSAARRSLRLCAPGMAQRGNR